MGENLARLVALLGVTFLTGCSTINGWVEDGSSLFEPAALEEVVSEMEPFVAWSQSVGAGTDGLWVALNHQMAGGTLYAASADGVVAAIDAASGGTVWERTLQERIMSGVALSERNLYLGTESGQLVAMDRVTGEEQWSVSLMSEILAAPAVSSGVVVVRTVDGRLVGLSEEAGSELWRYQREVPVLTLRGTSSPLIAGGRVVAGLDSGEVVALSLQDGRELWIKSVTSPRGRTEIERMVDIDADPVISPDGIVYVVSYQGDLAALNVEQGDLIWKRKVSATSAPMIYGPYLFLSDSEGNVWAFDRKDGSALWKQDGLEGRNLTTPLLSGVDLIVGDAEGYLHWISAEDGHFRGRLRVDSEGVSALPLSHDGRVMVLGQSGKLSAIVQN